MLKQTHGGSFSLRFGPGFSAIYGEGSIRRIGVVAEIFAHTDTIALNVLSIVSRIRPSLELLFETDLHNDPEQLFKAAIRSNVLASTNSLRHGSQMLEQLVLDGSLAIVAAEY